MSSNNFYNPQCAGGVMPAIVGNTLQYHYAKMPPVMEAHMAGAVCGGNLGHALAIHDGIRIHTGRHTGVYHANRGGAVMGGNWTQKLGRLFDFGKMLWGNLSGAKKRPVHHVIGDLISGAPEIARYINTGETGAEF